jgi:Uma2 family endonuclease
MSAITQSRLMTAEEFAELPNPEDGSRQELVNGVVITMPPPSFYHGQVCLRIGR